MTPSPARQLRILSGEAVRDAGRRRIVTVIVILSLVSLWFVDGCTSCATGQVQVNGRSIEGAQLLGWTGAVLLGMLALWTVVLAGVLASDHLTTALEDGSATLVLARPVGRTTFVLARLAGSLAIAFAIGVLLLGGAAAFIRSRYGLPLAPVVAAGSGSALAAVVVAAFAMGSSLLLPRVATFLLVFASVGGMTVLDLVAALGVELRGTLAVVQAYGPPVGAVLASALAPWTGSGAGGDLALLELRLAIWAALAVGLLVLAFRRLELASS